MLLSVNCNSQAVLETRIRVPTFSVVYFRRENPPPIESASGFGRRPPCFRPPDFHELNLKSEMDFTVKSAAQIRNGHGKDTSL